MTGSVRPVSRQQGVALLAGVVLVGCGGGGSSSATKAEGQAAVSPSSATTAAASSAAPSGVGDAVTVKLFSFSPTPLTVKVGTKVTWTNFDEILHTVTSGSPPGAGDGTFSGPMDGKGTSFAFTFERPGSYRYFCMRHNSMTGQVDVS
jgi:plastocyanin